MNTENHEMPKGTHTCLTIICNYWIQIKCTRLNDVFHNNDTLVTVLIVPVKLHGSSDNVLMFVQSLTLLLFHLCYLNV